MCDVTAMTALAEHIRARPGKSMQAWADEIGISRPYLYGLMDGSRTPSVEVAVKVERATDGAVTVTDWPNLAAVLSAVKAAS